MNRVKFYLASNDNNGNPVNKESLELIKAKLARLLGGFTEFNAVGYYVNQDDKLIIEHTSILESFSQGDFKSDILSIAQDYKESCGQESVLIEYNQEVIFC